MKYAADFKRTALDALKGNWRVAVLTGFVASLLGGTIASSGGGGSSSSNDSSNNSLNNLQLDESTQIALLVLLCIVLLIFVWALVTFIVGGAAKLGYAKFNLNLIDHKPAVFSDLFSQFNRLGTGFCMNLLTSLYVFFWMLLFIIPGIVKSYSYAMTPYILAEHPEMSVNEAITESRRIMNGNKGRLFCLQLSFIGWALLCSVPVLVLAPLAFIGAIGIVLWLILSLCAVVVGGLFLTPYREAAQAAFYREITYVPPYVPHEEI